MIIVVGVAIFLGVCALFLVGLGDSHGRVTRMLDALEENEQPVCTPVVPAAAYSPKPDVFSEVSFTRSLLALSKVRSLDPYDSPKPGLVEPSETCR